MKNFRNLILAGMFMFLMVPLSAGNCVTGGPGATACTNTTNVTILGVGFQKTVSITCSSGYACCKTFKAECVGGNQHDE